MQLLYFPAPPPLNISLITKFTVLKIAQITNLLVTYELRRPNKRFEWYLKLFLYTADTRSFVDMWMP